METDSYVLLGKWRTMETDSYVWLGKWKQLYPILAAIHCSDCPNNRIIMLIQYL